MQKVFNLNKIITKHIRKNEEQPLQTSLALGSFNYPQFHLNMVAYVKLTCRSNTNNHIGLLQLNCAC